MRIDPETWAKIRVAIKSDDEETFEQIVVGIVHQRTRDEIARRAVAERARCGGDRPYLCCQR